MSEPYPSPRLRTGDSEREAVLCVLQEAHAMGRLSLEELNERQEQALAARYADELVPLTADLPEAVALGPQPVLPAQAASVGQVAYPESLGTRIAVMSGREVRLPPGCTRYSGFAFWGGDEVTLTDALGPGVVVEINASAIMGGFQLRVPPGVRVVDKTIAIMAGVEVKKEAQGDGSFGTVILEGFLFWAGIEVALDPRSVQPY